MVQVPISLKPRGGEGRANAEIELQSAKTKKCQAFVEYYGHRMILLVTPVHSITTMN